MPVGDLFYLNATWETTGLDTAQNRWAFRQAEGLVFDEPGEDLCQAFIDQALGPYLLLVSSVFTLAQLSVRGITNPLYGFDLATPGNPGQVSGQCLPFTNAAIISWRTSLIGRQHRGRTYLPPTGESVSDSGILSPTYMGLMDDFAEAMIGMADGPSVTYADWELGIYSGVTPAEFNPVVSHISRQIMGTVRSRRPK